MAHFGLSSTHLLGHHTGALIVTEMALTWPDQVSKVIQNGPVPVTPEEAQFFIDNAVANEKAWAMQEDGSCRLQSGAYVYTKALFFLCFPLMALLYDFAVLNYVKINAIKLAEIDTKHPVWFIGHIRNARQ